MRDNEVRLSQVIVAPMGSTVHNHAPNSADAPLGTFDLIITGEAGDDINSSSSPYTMSYTAFDITAVASVPAFSAALAQNFGDANWIAINTDDFVTTQTFTLPRDAAIAGHVIQFTATLVSHEGDITSFVQSEPFMLV